jgi:hypothetical protein
MKLTKYIFKSVCEVTKLSAGISMSVHPSVPVSAPPSIIQFHGPGTRRRDLRYTSYGRVFVVKYVQKIHAMLKLEKNNKKFI